VQVIAIDVGCHFVYWLQRPTNRHWYDRSYVTRHRLAVTRLHTGRLRRLKHINVIELQQLSEWLTSVAPGWRRPIAVSIAARAVEPVYVERVW